MKTIQSIHERRRLLLKLIEQHQKLEDETDDIGVKSVHLQLKRDYQKRLNELNWVLE